MSWVRPDRELLPHTPANAQLDAVMVVNSRKLSRKYRTNRVLNPGPVVCKSSMLSARPQRLPVNLSVGLNRNTREASFMICFLCQAQMRLMRVEKQIDDTNQPNAISSVIMGFSFKFY